MNDINSRGLLVGKALYFLIFAALGIFVPFLNVYYKSIGLNGVQIGLINTLSPLIAIFASPMWGLMVDRLGQVRPVIAAAVLGLVLSTLGLSTVTAFGLIIVLSAVLNLFASGVMPMLDSYTLSQLGTRRERYGSQRIWGTIGFLISSALSGNLVAWMGLKGVFWSYAVLMGLFLLTVFLLPAAKAQMGRTVFSGFARMIRQPVWIVLAITLILVMMANSSWLNFLGITIKEMGGSDALIGRAWSLGALSEIPVMWFSTRLLARFGARKLMSLGFIFYGVRLVLYAVMPQPEWALGINLLHGLSFGLYWIGGVNYVSEITPPALSATGQSMLATFFNIASVLGGPVIGWVLDTYGPARMFSLAAATCLIAVTIFTLSRARVQPAESG